MNKRKLKSIWEWWNSLELHEKEDYITVCIKGKPKAWNFKPADSQLEKMYDWAHGS